MCQAAQECGLCRTLLMKEKKYSRRERLAVWILRDGRWIEMTDKKLSRSMEILEVVIQMITFYSACMGVYWGELQKPV